jgi:hypothetical protein
MSTFHGHTVISIEVKSVERHCVLKLFIGLINISPISQGRPQNTLSPHFMELSIYFSRTAISFKQMPDLLWNHWPASCGISGRNEMEGVAGMAWNTHSLEY